MRFQAKPLSAGRRRVAFLVGAAFLLGAATAVIWYVDRTGVDVLSTYSALVVALSTLMLAVGASGKPDRWRVVGFAAFALCAVSWLPLMIYGYTIAPIVDGAGDSGLLAILVGLLLLPAAPCVGMVGRPRPPAES